MSLKRANNKEITDGFLYFISYFVVLLFVSFVGVFCFFKSSELQQKNIEKEVFEYKSVLNKHYLLKTKIDTIHYHMTLLSTGKVRNDVFLENYIAKDIEKVKSIIGDDRTNDFKYYSFLVTKIDSLLLLKNKIIQVSDQENLALRDLNDCMGQFRRVQNRLNDDPTRMFNRR